jgi:hypothetical protein
MVFTKIKPQRYYDILTGANLPRREERGEMRGGMEYVISW